MTTTDTTPATSTGRGWNIGLWAAQIVLALMYAMAAQMKLMSAPAEMVEMGLAWVGGAPLLLVRFIGFAELLGTLGLILPAATRIMPRLTSLAALGLATIQVLAFFFHAYRGEFEVLPFNIILLALAVFVLWGRTRKSPIAPRA